MLLTMAILMRALSVGYNTALIGTLLLGCGDTNTAAQNNTSTRVLKNGSAPLLARELQQPDEEDSKSMNTHLKPKRNLYDPQQLVRAVFDAIVVMDSDAYLDLIVSTVEDFEDVAKYRTHPPVPINPEKQAALRDSARIEFEKLILELQKRGMDPTKARLVEVKTNKAVVKDELGFAEDLTAVLEQGDVRIPVTLDDCLLSRRGWLIADGLKLRD